MFANIAELYALSGSTFLSSRFTVVSVPFKVIVPNTKELTCHSFTGDLYLPSKPGRYGLLFYTAADANVRYMWKAWPYSGRPQAGVGHSRPARGAAV